MNSPQLIFPLTPSLNMSHFEFKKKALLLAHLFQDQLNGEVVGLLGNKGPEHLTCLYGAYLAQSTFYNLNHQLPLSMLVQVLHELKIKYLFVEEDHLGLFERLKKELPEITRIHFKDCPTSLSPLQSRNGSSIAYFISTTGTTGTPKLIAITRAQLDLSLKHLKDRLDLRPMDVYLHLSDLSFDVALMDLFLPLLVGSSIVFLPHSRLPMALNVVNEYKVSVWSSAPSLAKFVFSFNKTDQRLPSLKKIVHCGEIFDRDLFMNWKKYAREGVVINLYGPAEATIAITSFKKELSDELCPEILPIGELFDGHEFKISENQELLIRGEQVIKSYYGGTLLDEFYNTGDLVEINEQNLLVCKGRSDDQIKIQGMRFNLLLIEQNLKELYPEHYLACLKVDESIILFVKRSSSLIDETKMKVEMKKRVPSHFVPKKVILIDEFLINASGKLDRQSLLRYLK